ncbi:MAG: hypothetical protein ACREJE_11380, partial [Candidatus Rokuibacteriota bacterium]
SAGNESVITIERSLGAMSTSLGWLGRGFMVPPCRDEADMIPTIHSTNFQSEVKALGGRSGCARPDFPEEAARS